MRDENAVGDCWLASLALKYAALGGRSALVGHTHRGPLMVQKPLYPEGPDVCHTIVLHPPGGIAAGDSLEVDAELTTSSRVLMTTTGADRWYRSNDGRVAEQRLHFIVADQAILEWLPHETIFFNGTSAVISIKIELIGCAVYAGWEIWCLGRSLSGEQFTSGTIHFTTDVWKDSKLLWHEGGTLSGGDPLLDSPLGLNGHPVCGTFVMAGRTPSADVLTALRNLPTMPGGVERSGITTLPCMLVARYLGSSTYSARRYFENVWCTARPWLAGRPACTPRIWRS